MNINKYKQQIIFSISSLILGLLFYLFYFQRGLIEAGGIVGFFKNHGIDLILIYVLIVIAIIVCGNLLLHSRNISGVSQKDEGNKNRIEDSDATKYPERKLVGILLKTNFLVFERLKKVSFTKIVLATAILLTVFFSAIAINKHYNLQTGLFDFALEQQVIWNTSQGRPLEASVEVSNYLGDHFSPLEILPGLLYSIFPGVEFIFIFQVLCVALAALGIFFLAKKILKDFPEVIPFGIFLIFFFYMGISGLMLNDYHPVVVGFPFLVWGIYFYEFKSFKISLLLFFIASLAKEDVSIFIGMYGMYQLIFNKDKKGIILAIYGFLVGVITLFVLIPYFRGGPSDTLTRYWIWGSTGGEIVKNIILNPIKVIEYIFRRDQFTYLIRLFTPVAFLAFLAPKRLFIILPNIAINILTDYEGQLSTLNHYDMMTSIGIFLALMEALRFLKKKNLIKPAILSLLFVNILLISGHQLWRGIFFEDRRSDTAILLNQIKPQVKPEYILAATNRSGAHFGDREKLQVFDNGWITYTDSPDIVIVDTYSTSERIEKQFQELLNTNDYFVRNYSANIKVAYRKNIDLKASL